MGLGVMALDDIFWVSLFPFSLVVMVNIGT